MAQSTLAVSLTHPEQTTRTTRPSKDLSLTSNILPPYYNFNLLPLPVAVLHFTPSSLLPALVLQFPPLQAFGIHWPSLDIFLVSLQPRTLKIPYFCNAFKSRLSLLLRSRLEPMQYLPRLTSLGILFLLIPTPPLILIQ